MSIWIQQGWQCPCCNRVYSPTTPVCFHCPSKVTVASNPTPKRTWVGLTDIDYAGLPLEQVGLVRWAEANKEAKRRQDEHLKASIQPLKEKNT